MSTKPNPGDDVKQTGYSRIWRWWTFGSVVALGGLLYLVKRLVTEQNNLNKATLLTHLHNFYSTPEMYDAIQTVLDWNLDFDTDPSKQKHRRVVLHFLEFLGTLVRFGVIDERLLQERFRDQISIWEHLKPIHLRVQERVIRSRQPQLSNDEVSALAQRDVESCAAHWLYIRWKESRRPTWRF